MGDAPRTIRVLEKLLKNYYALLRSSPYMYGTAHYLLGRAYEKSGEKEKAEFYYEKFLTIWKNADPGIKEIDDAEARLESLKAKS